MTGPRGDEALRRLEREVEASGDTSARLRLAAELDRQGRSREAFENLADMLRRTPRDEDVRLALGKLRGPCPGPWGAIAADPRNTRRSTARGPRGLEGRVLERQPVSPWDAAERSGGGPPPLVGPAETRPLASVGVRTVLALTADGHAISHALGNGGIEVSAERDGHRSWRVPFPYEPGDDESRWSRSAHAALGPDGTAHVFVRTGKLVAVEPTGDVRWTRDVPATVTSLALDAARARLYVGYDHPAALAAFDPWTGDELWTRPLEPSYPPDETIVLDDGRVACVTPFRTILVVTPAGDLEPPVTCSERIYGAHGALAPSGDLVVVNSDPKGAHVEVFDPTRGFAKKTSFEVTECLGVPALDREGTVYLDGGARGYILGFDIVSGAVRYRLDRPTLWQQPDRPGSAIAVGDGEVVFLDFSGSEGVGLVRAGA